MSDFQRRLLTKATHYVLIGNILQSSVILSQFLSYPVFIIYERKPNSEANLNRLKNLSLVWLCHSTVLIARPRVYVPDGHISLQPSNVQLQSSLEGPQCVLWSKLDTDTDTRYITINIIGDICENRLLPLNANECCEIKTGSVVDFSLTQGYDQYQVNKIIITY